MFSLPPPLPPVTPASLLEGFLPACTWDSSLPHSTRFLPLVISFTWDTLPGFLFSPAAAWPTCLGHSATSCILEDACTATSPWDSPASSGIPHEPTCLPPASHAPAPPRLDTGDFALPAACCRHLPFSLRTFPAAVSAGGFPALRLRRAFTPACRISWDAACLESVLHLPRWAAAATCLLLGHFRVPSLGLPGCRLQRTFWTGTSRLLAPPAMGGCTNVSAPAACCCCSCLHSCLLLPRLRDGEARQGGRPLSDHSRLEQRGDLPTILLMIS